MLYLICELVCDILQDEVTTGICSNKEATKKKKLKKKAGNSHIQAIHVFGRLDCVIYLFMYSFLNYSVCFLECINRINRINDTACYYFDVKFEEGTSNYTPNETVSHSFQRKRK